MIGRLLPHQQHEPDLGYQIKPCFLAAIPKTSSRTNGLHDGQNHLHIVLTSQVCHLIYKFIILISSNIFFFHPQTTHIFTDCSCNASRISVSAGETPGDTALPSRILPDPRLPVFDHSKPSYVWMTLPELSSVPPLHYLSTTLLYVLSPLQQGLSLQLKTLHALPHPILQLLLLLSIWPNLITDFFKQLGLRWAIFVVCLFVFAPPSYLSVSLSPPTSVSILTILSRLAIKVINL